MLDWKIWSFSFMYMAGAVGVYAFLFFLPIILRNGLGYSLSMSFILSAPPALFSVIVAMSVSWLADKTRVRGPFVVLQGLIAIVGLCMTGFLEAPTPRYAGPNLQEDMFEERNADSGQVHRYFPRRSRRKRPGRHVSCMASKQHPWRRQKSRSKCDTNHDVWYRRYILVFGVSPAGKQASFAPHYEADLILLRMLPTTSQALLR